MKIVTFLRKNDYLPKRVVDLPRERDTFRNKIMEIVEDFDEKSYHNNGNFFHHFSSFFHFLIFFIFHFFHFFIFSFDSIFSFFHFFSFFTLRHSDPPPRQPPPPTQARPRRCPRRPHRSRPTCRDVQTTSSTHGQPHPSRSSPAWTRQRTGDEPFDERSARMSWSAGALSHSPARHLALFSTLKSAQKPSLPPPHPPTVAMKKRRLSVNDLLVELRIKM